MATHPGLSLINTAMVILSLLSVIAASNALILFTEFSLVPPVLILLTGTGLMISSRGLLSQLCTFVLTLLTAAFIFLMLHIVFPREFQQRLMSPSGKTELVIEYDHANRPSLYLRKHIFLKPIATPPFRGSLEKLTWSVKWVTDEEIMLVRRNSTESVLIKVE